MGLLVRFFKGGLQWSELWSETWKGVLFYYEIQELQATEEEVLQELSHDEKGNKKKLPHPDIIRKKTLERIEQRRNEVDGSNQ
jgi:hypothetical protein